MGKTDHDQHQIDKNHYCSVTFSKDNEWQLALLVLQNPCTTEEDTLVFKFKQIDTYRMKKYVSQLGIG